MKTHLPTWRVACWYYQRQIVPFLEDVLSPARRSAFTLHVSDCPDCRRELRAVQQAAGFLRRSASEPASPAPDLWRSLEYRLALQRTPRRAWIPSVLPAAGIALILICGVGYLTSGPQRLDDGSASSIATSAPGSATEPGLTSHSVARSAPAVSPRSSTRPVAIASKSTGVSSAHAKARRPIVMAALPGPPRVQPPPVFGTYWKTEPVSLGSDGVGHKSGLLAGMPARTSNGLIVLHGGYEASGQAPVLSSVESLSADAGSGRTGPSIRSGTHPTSLPNRLTLTPHPSTVTLIGGASSDWDGRVLNGINDQTANGVALTRLHATEQNLSGAGLKDAVASDLVVASSGGGAVSQGVLDAVSTALEAGNADRGTQIAMASGDSSGLDGFGAASSGRSGAPANATWAPANAPVGAIGMEAPTIGFRTRGGVAGLLTHAADMDAVEDASATGESAGPDNAIPAPETFFSHVQTQDNQGNPLVTSQISGEISQNGVITLTQNDLTSMQESQP